MLTSKLKQHSFKIPYFTNVVILKYLWKKPTLLNIEKTDNVCNEQVFGSIFTANSKTIFNYIYYKFGNEEKAYDAVQEAFVKLWENCSKVPPEKAKSFVYKVANNLYLNVIKAEKIRLKYADKSAKTTNETPEFIMEETQFKEKLDRALESLPENQRTTFLLNRIDGKKYAEIAEMEGVSVKAIEKRMHLALKTLRDKIDGI
ncbi:sigma-70 family RNA polymerase sigma factor [Euzebyella marina]|uniref:Sigma-70 family RNA polymerase sigma factor n=1 Tax=Euzebyella marina TaxID=1761453 RepID=A0A3G2L9L2_9FLAO|nr:sigma-70 family RNA polymerase sigma factor [Euzebyella marina]MAU71964.1 RNA polymerase subunit sigma-70 [Pseudozobellia sp.]MBG48632.1 RNA polymerase subunit sigma-70 [Pseudozobellia sp.]|tara:strand:- start:3042 stop:3647 length:606 start_codon:yes stop_codon:yes gene_type:complete